MRIISKEEYLELKELWGTCSFPDIDEIIKDPFYHDYVEILDEESDSDIFEKNYFLDKRLEEKKLLVVDRCYTESGELDYYTTYATNLSALAIQIYETLEILSGNISNG